MSQAPPPSPRPTGQATSSRPSRWLQRERHRTTLAVIAASVFGIVASQLSVRLGDVTAAQAAAYAIMGGWIPFCAIHAVTVWLAYRRLEGEEFLAALESDAGHLRDGGTVNDFVVGKTVSSWGLTTAFMALVGVMLLVFVPVLRADLVLLGLGGALVVTAWVDVLTTYAAHYARTDLTEGGLSFPGEHQVSMEDYLYFSAGVQKTFGTTDVEVVTTRMRRTVRTHGLLAFAFNSVIVAILVSLILTLG